MVSALTVALMAAEKGWYVFPLAPGTKVPPSGFNDPTGRASNEKSIIEKWAKQYPGCNWALAAGKSGLVIIDIDVKAGAPGLASWNQLIKEFPALPQTLSSVTPSRGFHAYYKGQSPNSAGTRLGPGIDVRSVGGYVVLPGSEIVGGEYRGKYAWNPGPNEPADIPEGILERLGRPRERDPLRDVPLVDLDEPDSIQRAIVIAQTISTDNTGFQVGCFLRDAGISEDMALEIFMEHHAPRCDEPWDIEVARKKIENAYLYAKDRIGNSSPARTRDAFEDLSELPGESPPGKLAPFFDYELEGEPPPRPWVVQDWLPQGEVSSLYGDGGQGKTLLAEQLGFCVSRGLPFFGINTARMPVFAALAEDDRGEVHRRVHNLRRYYSVSATDRSAHLQFFAYPSSTYVLATTGSDGKLTPGPFYKVLTGHLKQMPPGEKLVILDTLADIFDGNENIRSQANTFVKKVLRGICICHQATVLMLAHPSRAGMSNGDTLSGSTAWNGAVRNRLTLTGDKTIPDVRVLTRIKSNYAKSGEEIHIIWKEGVFVPVDESVVLRAIADQYADRVLGVLQDAVDAGKPFHDASNSTNCIKKSLALFPDANGKPMKLDLLERIIGQLIEEGRLKRITETPRKNGLYPVIGAQGRAVSDELRHMQEGSKVVQSHRGAGDDEEW